MFRSSISNSSQTAPIITTWSKVRRDLLRLMFVLLMLELLCRIPPVRGLLADRLDRYENLLWYHYTLPTYQDQLINGPQYDLWLIGSSYMMTALDPQQIESELTSEVTVQNYGYTAMRNFETMSQMIDWMFTFTRPRYVVLGTNLRNFTGNFVTEDARTKNSPYESMVIFPDSVDDRVTHFFYQNSLLYRYILLARNATFIPPENADLKSLPKGGFFGERIFPLDECEPFPFNPSAPPLNMADGLARLDTLIDRIRSRGIPLLVVNVPLPACALTTFENFESYEQDYLDPLNTHLTSLKVPFYALDNQFYTEIPLEEHGVYFDDLSHTNLEGAALLSQWTAEFVAQWLDTVK